MKIILIYIFLRKIKNPYISKFNLILFNIIPAIIFYSFVTEIYQEYFDPSILLFYFLFKNKIPENYSSQKLVGISIYFFVFLFSSFTYYNLL